MYNANIRKDQRKLNILCSIMYGGFLKKIVTVLIVISLLFSFTACSNENKQQRNETDKAAELRLTETFYQEAIAALNVVDEYLEGDRDSDSTYNKLQSIYGRMKDDAISSTPITIQSQVLILSLDINMDSERKQIIENRNKLAELLGEQ